MFKKIIAGVLSTTVICTTVLTGGFDSATYANKKSSDTHNGAENGEYELSASNSLAKFIKNSSEKSNINPEVSLLSNKTESIFAVTNLDFDAETGKLAGVSSQTNDCTIVFSFIDEETNGIAQEIKVPVKAGKSIFTEAKADITNLPQYYIVQAQLIDKNGNPVSNVFKISTYTKKMQEILAADIHDFNEEQVINFDENEDTNFIVLSEDTVKAESSDTVNTLVSYDYDNDAFVFENINDSIKYLESGDFLYVQADEENIVALAVEDVQIDGDTAKVKGNDEIDDMFAFVKFEGIATSEDAEVDTTNADEGVEYLEGEGNSDELCFRYIDRKPFSGGNTSTDKWSLSLGDKLSNLSKTEEMFKENEKDKKEYEGDEGFADKCSVSASFSLTITTEYNYYKSWGYTNVKVTETMKIGSEFNFTYSDERDEIFKAPEPNEDTENTKKKKMGEVDLKTPIPGLKITVKADFVYRIEVVGRIIYEKTWTRGFSYDSDIDDDMQEIEENPNTKLTDGAGTKMEIQGSLYCGFVFGLSVSFGKFTIPVIKKKCSVAEAGVSCEVGLLASAKEKIGESKYDIETGEDVRSSDIFVLNKDGGDSTHACIHCIAGEANFIIKCSINAKVLGTIGFNHTFVDSKIKLCDFHCSWRDSIKPYCGTGKCEYLAYKNTLNVNLTDEAGNGINAENLIIKIDGKECSADNGSVTAYYAPDKRHYYEVYTGETRVGEGIFTTINSKKVKNVNIVVQTDADGKILSGEVTDSSESGNEPPKTTTTQTTVQTTTTTVATTFVKPQYMMSEYLELGEGVVGMLYNDGTCLILGAGDMYENPPVFENPQKIKTVVFEDYDPKEGLYITSICNNLFRGATNLETVYLSNEITKIGESAFSGCKNLKYFRYGGEKDTTETFVLPSKLETIGNWAFNDCSSAVIGKLVIGSNTKTIGEGAFAGCSEITSVVIPETVTKIEPKVFRDCKKLETADIRAKVTDNRMGAGLFYNCEALEELTIPTFNSFYYYRIWLDGSISEDKIFIELFYNCENKYDTQIPSALKKVTVLNGTEIPDNYFSGFNHIETYALPEGITNIGIQAFHSNSSLSKIICNDKTKDLSFSEMIKDVENIGEGAFSSGDQIGSNLEIGELVFGNKLKSIGGSAFSRCNKITRVEIPENVTKIEPLAFSYCGKIETAVIKANVTDNKMGAGLFCGCGSLKELTVPCFTEFYYFLPSPKWDVDYDMLTGNVFSMLFNNCSVTGETIVPSTLKKVTVLNGTEIPDNYFSGSGNIETYALPEGIISIGIRAFYSSASIKKIICNDENKDLTFSELFKDVEYIGMEAFREDKNLEIGELVFGNKLDSIGSGAFIRCGTITSVVIPESATVIEPTVFYECGNIKTAVIKANVTDNIMGAGMFYGCDLLEELTLPNFNDFYYNTDWRGAGTQEKSNVFSMLFNACSTRDGARVPSTLKKLTILNGENMPKNCLDGFKLKTLVLPSELKFADSNATQDIKDTYEEVIYKGTEEEWANVVIEDPNDPLRGPITFSPEEWKTGDANGDGDIDMSDIVLIMQALANPNKYGINGTDPTHITENGFKYGDVNGDGLTVNDAVRIQEYLLGKISTLA